MNSKQNGQINQCVKNISDDDVEHVNSKPAEQMPVLSPNCISITGQDINLDHTNAIPSVESYISLDPPSYSPITPLNSSNVHVKTHRSLDLDLSDNSDEVIENSPVGPMSPATRSILETIIFDDSDDSVKDPDYTIVPESSDISDTDSESILTRNVMTQAQNLENNNIMLHRDIEEEISDSVQEEDHNIPNIISISEEVTEGDIGQRNQPRPKRGRKRKNEEYTLAERKQRKYANLPYKGKSKDVSAKIFRNYECVCKKQCHINVSQEDRKKEFEKFIGLGSYEAQLLYICSKVTEKVKGRSYTSRNNTSRSKPRNFVRTYTILDVPVCRDMFLNTYQVTTQKITISLKKQRSGAIRDYRGFLSGGRNKTSQEDLNFVCNLINKLPKYESHYRRSQNGDALYLQPGLTIQKIYDLYISEFKQVNGDEKKPISLPLFRRIFIKKFNLRFKTLKKDTCNKCDTFAAKLKANLTMEDRSTLLAQRETHLNSAENLRSQMNSHIERAKTDEHFECITFDMEKTLPLPRIPTNVVFYKRQLWFYNCGIHVSSNNQGYCFVWVEGEAGRGAQEVGSCITKFINDVMRPNVEHLSLWSDSCGGQNRNIKMVLLLKVILNAHPTLKTIELNFLESGHTFLPNDTDFGKIESHLKHFQRLYTAEDYINVIKSCTKKTPLIVIRMAKKEFLSTERLEKNITNRKTFVNKHKVNWLNTKHIQLKKESVYSVFMKSENSDEYQELYIGKKLKGNLLSLCSELLFPLWPNGKPIMQAKLDDLKSMFHLIPDDCLTFYKQLKGIEGYNDDIEGFGGELDFDLE